MAERVNISSNAKWEDIVGYSRAVRVGNQIYVSGTVAINSEGNVIGINDPHKQTIESIKIIEQALIKADSKLSDVVRTRIYVTNINDWEKIGKAHGEFFKDIKPATSMLEVSKLISPDVLVEIEADAILTLEM